jgi:Family of unknown function (DUF5678)
MTGTSATQTKQIVESVVTSALSPEETILQLDRYGIEWYIAEVRTLMYRSWQVGAENFVSPQDVPRLQAGRQMPTEADALDWMGRNLDELRARYSGQWVAIVRDRVVAHAPSVAALLEALTGQGEGGGRPLITQVPAEPVTWITTYANQRL